MNQNNSNDKLLHGILAKYGLKVANIAPVQSGYRNHSYQVELVDGSYKNLIIFKSETGSPERINRADAVSQALHKAGLPVRYRTIERVMKLQPKSNTPPRLAALYNYLPGSTISWESYTKDHLKVLGIAMAKMHKVLSLEPGLAERVASEINLYDELGALLERIESYFSDKKAQEAARTKLGITPKLNFKTLRKVLRAAQALPTQQVLHMDFVRGNILFSKEAYENVISFGDVNISGIIDFEKTSYGSPLFDIARTLAFLYVDCKYKSTEKVRKYFLYSGYKKYGSCNVESLRLLDELVKLFLLHDFYKFLLHNPYEYLYQNEHYLRTRDILRSENMLEYSHTD